MKAIIERLSNKINTLVAQYDELKYKHQKSLSKVDDLSLELDKCSTTIQQLEEKINILKLSTSIKTELGGNKVARKQINELVRKIDKCIALLNK
ncbi:MAG: hypothetical protein VX344_05415 [Bacteroidota bacterium]|nr:hypothetical protein [Bacteroidota bacterium]